MKIAKESKKDSELLLVVASLAVVVVIGDVEGAGEVLDGAMEVLDGEVEVLDGAMEVLDGEVEVLDGVVEVVDGTVEVVDGVVEVVDGTVEEVCTFGKYTDAILDQVDLFPTIVWRRKKYCCSSSKDNLLRTLLTAISTFVPALAGFNEPGFKTSSTVKSMAFEVGTILFNTDEF